MAFLRTFGLLGLEIRIFYCRAPCLVYLAMQPRRKPIFGLLGFSHSETGVSGWISRHPGKTFTDSAVRRRFGATTPNGTHLLNGTEFAETRAPARRPSSRMSDPKTILDATLTVVLAGGDGKRLLPLTEDRPKSALPIGGPFKLIDFTLSNCFNSGLRRLFLLTQYKSEALHCYIRDGWSALWYRPAGDSREYIVCLPPACGKHYRGTADAVFQNLQIITREDPKFILVLSSDHVYRMDYTQLLERHANSGAAVTIAQVRQPSKRGSRIVNIGVYAFTARALVRALAEDAEQVTNHDLEAHIVPRLTRTGAISAYDFQLYWRGIRTIDSYYEANIELAQAKPPFDPYRDETWPIRAGVFGVLHPSDFVLPAANGFSNSVISPGVST